MALRDVEQDLVELLEQAGQGHTAATPPDTAPSLIAGPMPVDGPDELVNVQDLGSGEDALPFLGGGGRMALAPEVTVRIRGQRRQYLATRMKAVAVWEACWESKLDGYVRVVPQGSGPTYLGPDEVERHRFSFTVLMEYRA